MKMGKLGWVEARPNRDSLSIFFAKDKSLIDFTVSFECLSLLDVNSRYHQIFMHPNDKEKKSFINDTGTSCYKTMPLSLKNDEATYQHIINKVFKN